MQHFFYIFVHVLLGQEYKREDEVPNEGDVIVWTPEPQSAHLSAVLLPVECPNHQVLCQSGGNKLLCMVQSPSSMSVRSGKTTTATVYNEYTINKSNS